MNQESENQLVDAGAETLDTWALLELFGHSKVAGRLTTRKLGTEVMFQVDVPSGEAGFSHSELYSPKAIFAVKPTTEAWCRRWAVAAKQFDRSPIPYVPEVKEPEGPRALIEDEADQDED